MDHTIFATACKNDGFGDMEEKSGMANFSSKPHTHPFAVRALILSGEFRLTRNGETEVFRPGASFSMQAGCEHAESYGPHGATYLVARKHD
jgi:hypothetical protein